MSDMRECKSPMPTILVTELTDRAQVSSRDESFLDLSIDIEQNSSVTACLRQFSASEMLCQKNKFFCDGCCDLQEAEKRYLISAYSNTMLKSPQDEDKATTQCSRSTSQALQVSRRCAKVHQAGLPRCVSFRAPLIQHCR